MGKALEIDDEQYLQERVQDFSQGGGRCGPIITGYTDREDLEAFI